MIAVENIFKKYEKTVLDNISLSVESGQICCLLGKNGAGKSTLLKIVGGLSDADSGQVIVNRRNIKSNALFQTGEIGLMSDRDNIINELSGYQFLVLKSLIFNISKLDRETRISSLTEYFYDDTSVIHRRTSTYSSGMRIKLRIIASLLQKPAVLVLDEPFVNLDPISANKLVELLKYFVKNNNRAILISSHDLMYVDRIATQICVLDGAKIVFDGRKEEFTRNESGKIDKALLDMIDMPKHPVEKLSWII